MALVIGASEILLVSAAYGAPVVTVSPATGVANGQAVQIAESGAPPTSGTTWNAWEECPAAATALAQCQALLYWGPTSNTSLSTAVKVYRTIQTDQGTFDCAVAACVVGVGVTSDLVRSQDNGPILASTPLSFSQGSCADANACNSTQAVAATTQAPALTVSVTGTPTGGTGTVALKIVSGTLACPQVASQVRPVATLTDTGFVPSDRLNVTASLPLASATSSEQVCFQSTIPFKSQSNPTVAKAGTAFLLNCTQVANVAPCVKSSQPVGSNIVVKFDVSGGDPTFSIVSPTGREAWASHIGTGTVGTAYTAQFQTKGGKAPFHWNLTGKLPPGCTFHAASGTITGTPTTKGKYTVAVQATDSEKPKGKTTQPLSVPITVT